MNSTGYHFRVTTFGESHGPYVGGVIDGCPSGIRIDFGRIERMLQRRRGRGGISTARQEADEPVFISGLLDGVTTGTPLAFIFSNGDKRSKDYDELKGIYRPSHADYSYDARYGIRDHRGGGRASARETVVRVVAGAIAAQILAEQGVEILSYTSQIGEVSLKSRYDESYTLEEVERSRAGCPARNEDDLMYHALMEAREQGDSLGGVVSTIIKGVPAGWGNPLYDKLDARLAAAMMGIGAAKGFEMGDGFGIASLRGSVANDPFDWVDGRVVTISNHSGGVQGGISNGATICFRTAFKPIASIARTQETVDSRGMRVSVRIGGRHDVSVFPRVLPVVDAMAAITLVDLSLGLEGVRSTSLLSGLAFGHIR